MASNIFPRDVTFWDHLRLKYGIEMKAIADAMGVDEHHAGRLLHGKTKEMAEERMGKVIALFQEKDAGFDLDKEYAEFEAIPPSESGEKRRRVRKKHEEKYALEGFSQEEIERFRWLKSLHSAIKHRDEEQIAELLELAIDSVKDKIKMRKLLAKLNQERSQENDRHTS